MNDPSRPPPPADNAQSRESAPDKAKQPENTSNAKQPPDTGANRGSPAAPVMKQFAKTKSESTGKP